MNKRTNIKLKGFTIVEILIVMVLTSITITFAYGTLNYIQKLFSSTKEQQVFIQDYCNLNNRLLLELRRSEFVKSISDNEVQLIGDSAITKLEFKPNFILIKSSLITDTFHLEAGKVEKREFVLPAGLFDQKLINEFSFPVKYSGQVFNLYFYKEYNSAVLMKYIRK